MTNHAGLNLSCPITCHELPKNYVVGADEEKMAYQPSTDEETKAFSEEDSPTLNKHHSL